MNSNQRTPAPWTTRGTLAVALGLLGLLIAGCGGEEAAVSGSEQAAGAERVALRAAVVAEGVPTVAVDRLMRHPGDHAGRLAVQGVVVQSVPERGALLLVDLDEFKSCGLNACTDASMPVRVAPAGYEGALPQPGEFVTMIGDFEAGERGFTFELVEIHREGDVVLARKAAGEG